MTGRYLLQSFLDEFVRIQPVYARTVDNFLRNANEEQQVLAETMIRWAMQHLGESYIEILTDGYCHFVADVNRSQREYERTKRYKNSSYIEVYKATYALNEFMRKYHWGVYTTTFAWEHHSNLVSFFLKRFIPKLVSKENLTVVDFGCGSGIWHFLASEHLNASFIGVDISPTSISETRKMAAAIGKSAKCSYVVNDATKFGDSQHCDAAISCFLLEHLENPMLIFKSISRSLSVGGHAFITLALTAAEFDHIYEFKFESEALILAERCGFRVIESLSLAPSHGGRYNYYLPRSMAIIVQKKHGEIW